MYFAETWIKSVYFGLDSWSFKIMRACIPCILDHSTLHTIYPLDPIPHKTPSGKLEVRDDDVLLSYSGDEVGREGRDDMVMIAHTSPEAPSRVWNPDVPIWWFISVAEKGYEVLTVLKPPVQCEGWVDDFPDLVQSVGPVYEYMNLVKTVLGELQCGSSVWQNWFVKHFCALFFFPCNAMLHLYVPLHSASRPWRTSKCLGARQVMLPRGSRWWWWCQYV